MCGITGIFAFNLVGKFNLVNITAATQALHRRGPDHQDIYFDEYIGLGHRRLSIIDTSAVAHQPMWDETGRYCIVFNGEIFNFQELRQSLERRGVTSFFSHSDTEVLLKLFILDREKCLDQLNGFFAFCVYDKDGQSFFVARDRYGVKPLLYLFDDDKFLFASEMKSILCYGIDKTIDTTALTTYLQLNYIPAPRTIFSHVHKLLPGHYLTVRRRQVEVKKYYQLPLGEESRLSYPEAQQRFRELLEAAVQRRLIADVPLGSFLSGGIDSSIITGLAARHKPNLHTFSIGFRDEKFFDETDYARAVAKHFNTEHTVFSLTNRDLYEHVHGVLDYLDEPFADSSAINVYILSRETRKQATVALSGDGADELLAGYNKHEAFRRMLQPGWKEKMVGSLGAVWKNLPQSRNGKVGNTVRQLNRFASAMKLAPNERYWRWAGYAEETSVQSLLSPTFAADGEVYRHYKNELLSPLTEMSGMNGILREDFHLVLPNDMLTKVDLMSMANALEVRTPFLDVDVVNFVFSLPGDYKINSSLRKRLAQDAYRDFLPAQLYNRPKKGFEVPLLKWLRTEMKSIIEDDLLSKSFVEQQNIFSYDAIAALKRQLFSSSPGDVHARIWALLVFQWWWRKYGKA